MRNKLAQAFLDIILPRNCIVCGKELSLQENHVCTGCLADLPRTHFSQLRRNPMADRFNSLPDMPGGYGYAYATALFYYRAGTGYRNITRRLKYHSDIGAGRFFGRMLGREMAGSALFRDVDAVVPVPLHWTRRWSRGYNQADVIAKELAISLDAAILPKVLVRCRRTRTQTMLSVGNKALNVAGAFRMKDRTDLSVYSHVLLVDDVFTTGATLSECYKAIVASGRGPGRISVATLAFTGG